MDNNILEKLDELSDGFFRRTKHYLPTFGRLFLVLTFFEDGLRMWFQWHEQAQYMSMSWGWGTFISYLFVFVNLVGQIVPCVLILVRKYVEINCGILFGIIVLQTIAYSIFTDMAFLCRSVSLVGGLLLLLAELRAEPARSTMAGVPQVVDVNRAKNWLQLFGRCMLILMFITLLFNVEASFSQMIQLVVGGVLMTLVVVGYKTKLSALVLASWLLLFNMYLNQFWTVESGKPLHDFLKYDFFQTLSVVGGLLLVVATGPGGVSIDAKKRW